MLYECDVNDKKNLKIMNQVSIGELNLLEKDLENLLAEILESDGEWMPIFQERNFRPEPDLVALDSNGNLIIFELKRYSADSWTIHQIMNYYRSFGSLSYDDLNQKFKKYLIEKNYSGEIKELADFHKENFGLDEPLPKNYFNRIQKMMIVANVADSSLIEDIKYLKQQGLYNIDFTPYRFYKIGEKIYFEFFTKPYDLHIDSRSIKGVMFDTCEKYYAGAFLDMFAKAKISAYGDKEDTVYCFNKGDYVFYYKNGIIGAGIIISDVIQEQKIIPGYNTYESYCKVKLLTPALKDYREIKCISASKIKNLLGHGFFFATTAKVPYLDESEVKILVNESRKLYDLPPIS